MRFVLATALLMTGVLTGATLAQDWKGHARVDGRVVDEGGAPVVGAAVDARRVSSPGGLRVTSDAEGRFVVDGIASGSWVVEVAAPGYRLHRLGVHLPSDSSWLGPVEVRLEGERPAPEVPDGSAAVNAAIASGPAGYEDVRDAIETGRIDRARQLLLGIEPGTFEDADTLFAIGLGFLNAGETTDAVELLGRALERDSAHVDAHYRRALGLLALGRHAEAREDLEAVLELQPEGALAEKAGRALTHLTPGPAEEQ
jgi:hypothetical protein